MSRILRRQAEKSRISSLPQTVSEPNFTFIQKHLTRVREAEANPQKRLVKMKEDIYSSLGLAFTECLGAIYLAGHKADIFIKIAFIITLSLFNFWFFLRHEEGVRLQKMPGLQRTLEVILTVCAVGSLFVLLSH